MTCLGGFHLQPHLVHHHPDHRFRFPPKSTSHPNWRCEAASISGSPSDYPEELLGAEKKKKKKKSSIAGIDQDELLDPIDLADPDSCFLPFSGLQFHYKISHEYDQNKTRTTTVVGFPMILLHGFGASLYSWDRAIKPLATLTSSKVLAFDRPAFGLTSRLLHTHTTTTSLNPYSMPFSVRATLFFLDHLAADKAILIGHSAGSLVAVDTYFEAPERVAAMILVSPAVLAPRTSSKAVKDDTITENKIKEETSNSNVQKKPFIWIGKFLSKFAMSIAHSIVGMLKGMANLVSSLYRRALTAILCSTIAVMLVRMVIDKFGIAGIRNAWYDASQITDHVLNGYTKPLRVKGWDRSLVEYTVAMLTDSTSESKPPLSKRLGEISCPVLVITGDSDRIVPSWNAKRLSQAIPGSCLEVIKNCGHLPHEEKVEEFVSVVQKFLQGVFRAPEEQFLQAAT